MIVRLIQVIPVLEKHIVLTTVMIVGEKLVVVVIVNTNSFVHK